MLNINEKTLLLNLIGANLPISEIAQKTGKSIGTIYKYKRLFSEQQNIIPSSSDNNFVSPKILPFESFIKSQLKAGVRNKSKIFQDLQRQDFKGSYALLNAYIKNLQSFDSSYKPSAHVETEAGEQAQVDWGSFGEIRIGDRKEKLHAFVYVLSYSRAIYVEFVVRQNFPTFLGCHIHAFEKLGIPKKIRYDNVKTVVLGRDKLSDGTENIRYNPAFIAFANYYGFAPELCPRYWPRSKGKVEAGVKYLKNNFAGSASFKKDFQSLEKLNEQAMQWLTETANQRIHKSTQQKPAELWESEKQFLRFPTNIPSYPLGPTRDCRSNKDALVQYQRNWYSVPHNFAQKKLFVKEFQEHGLPFINIYYKGALIATHKVPTEKGKWVMEDKHVMEPEAIDSNKPPNKKEKKITHEPIILQDPNYYNSLIPKS